MIWNAPVANPWDLSQNEELERKAERRAMYEGDVELDGKVCT